MTAGRLVDGEEAMSVGTTSSTRDPHVAAANLRRHGRRATSARISLMLSLSELGHATPEQLHTTLAPTHPRLNASTVYRTLESLTDIGPSPTPTPTSPDRPPATTSPTAPSTPTSSARTAAPPPHCADAPCNGSSPSWPPTPDSPSPSPTSPCRATANHAKPSATDHPCSGIRHRQTSSSNGSAHHRRRHSPRRVRCRLGDDARKPGANVRSPHRLAIANDLR